MPGCWILSLHLLFQLNNNLVKNKIMKKVMLLVLVSTLSFRVDITSIKQERYQAICWGSSEVCNQKPPYFFKWFLGGYYLWYLYSVKNYILCTYK